MRTARFIAHNGISDLTHCLLLSKNKQANKKMSSEEREEVEVLYDYSYSDDQGLVEIHEGDIYKLLEKTNSEWWHVYSTDEEDGFFVPAQYVRIVKGKSEDQEVNNALSSLDDALGGEEETDYENSAGLGVLQVGGQAKSKASLPALPTPPAVNGMGKNADAAGEYMNLDQFRADAKIPPLDNQSNFTDNDAKESDYANLPFQLLQQQQQQQQQQKPHQGQELGPWLEDGQFVRVLLEGLPWDIYEDKSKRRFFHNRDTGELTWKPPRKDKPSSPVGSGPTSSASSMPALQPPSFVGRVPSPAPGAAEVQRQDEYTKSEEGGDVFYVHNSTNEKWQQLTDHTGRQYYHRLGSNDTQWALPVMIQRSTSESQDVSPRNGEPSGGEGGAVPVFTVRPMSMYGKIERTQPPLADPKACTLPPNFAPGSQVEKSPSLPSFQLQPPSQHRFEDQLCGYLNKTKIADIGKKKIKKSWGQAYVVLQSTNLVFYKDQKAAAQKPSSPHGKPEGVISLLGAKVDFNPPKEVTSRRNTIMLSATSGSQFLLHSDDEKFIHEWFFRLKMVANDISKDSSPREQDGSLGRSGLRTISESGADSGGERLRNMVGIKAKLLGFLSRRPTREDLIKDGIILDAVFGSTLQSLCERDKSPVPNFVLECITAVESKGLNQDGLYRISGNLAEIQRLRYVVDKDDDHNLQEDQWDIHTLTGALKLFFRELKEPLFPFKCMDKFLSASKKEIRKEKMKAFKEALSHLPKNNYETLRVLLTHLKNVVQHSAENRMQTQNVAIVFGPTLMWLEEGDFSNMAILTVYQSKVVEFLLLEFDNLFR